MANRHLIFNKVQEQSGIVLVILQTIVHDDLEMTMVCSYWVPHSLTPQHGVATKHSSAPSRQVSRTFAIAVRQHRPCTSQNIHYTLAEFSFICCHIQSGLLGIDDGWQEEERSHRLIRSIFSGFDVIVYRGCTRTPTE